MTRYEVIELTDDTYKAWGKVRGIDIPVKAINPKTGKPWQRLRWITSGGTKGLYDTRRLH